MAGTIIFHFSGSGNSLAVARDLAERLDARLVPVAEALKHPDPFGAAASLGFIFPLMDFKANKRVFELAGRLKNPQGRYLFAVCTYGISPGRSLVKFSRVFHRRGGRLSAGFTVAMPQSGIGSARTDPTEDREFYRIWRDRRDGIAETLRAKHALRLESAFVPAAFMTRRVRRMMVSLFKLIGLLISKGPRRLRMRAGEACIGCGTCVSLCPMGNIAMSEGRPIWDANCAGCFACFHWCRLGAVSFGGYSLDTRQMRHPDISVADMALRPQVRKTFG